MWISLFWKPLTFKNDFFKNLILHKTFPPNSEQVWKMICMVKIISPASRSIFRVFLVIFPEFGCPCEIWVDIFRNFSNLCTKNLEIYPRESLQIFVRVLYEQILFTLPNRARITNLEKKFFPLGKKIWHVLSFFWTHLNNI